MFNSNKVVNLKWSSSSFAFCLLYVYVCVCVSSFDSSLVTEKHKAYGGDLKIQFSLF